MEISHFFVAFSQYELPVISAANANYISENRDTIYIVWFLNLVKLRRHHEISIGFALNYTRLQNLSILVVIS